MREEAGMLDTGTYAYRQVASTTRASLRVDSIDIVRGLAMIFMLMNHSSWHIPGLNLDANNNWYDPTPIAALSNKHPEAWLNLLQGTPMFFVLAGFSLAFFEQSRYKRNWGEWQITRYLLIRGNVLILVDLPLPGFVLSSIGFCLWLFALLRLLPLSYLIVLAVSLTVAMQILYENTPIPNDVNLLRSILMYPSPKDPMLFGYPVLSWIAVIVLGYVSGQVAIMQHQHFANYAAFIGLVSFAIWAVLTLDGGFGRLYSGHPMILTKHPPSLAYLSFYMGITFTLISLLTRLPSLARSGMAHFLALLGQVAFFFYICHFIVVLVISLVVIRLQQLSPLAMNFVVMALSLVVLFPVCQRYKKVRRNHPDSVLQYL